MATRLVWKGDKFLQFARERAAAGLQAAGTELHRIARQKASIPNPGVTVAQQRVTAGSNATQRTIYPSPSQPGESPRRRTGFGQKNIVGGFSRVLMAFRVGYSRLARYMTFHELGIRYSRKGLQQRATIVPAMRENLGRLGAIFRRAMTSGGGKR